MILQTPSGGRIVDNAVLQHHVCLHDLPTFLVRDADYRALLDIGMRQKGGLHLRTCNVVASRDNHVVGAGGEMEIAVVVLPECIASEVPAILNVSLLPLVGEITAAGRATDREPANLATRLFIHGFIDDL